VQARQEPTPPRTHSRARQRRLYVAAQRRRSRRVQARSARIVRPELRWRAWPEGRVDGGAAGVEGVTMAPVDCQGAEPCVEQIRPDLRAGIDPPPPVVRVPRPKPGGGPRPSGMPTVRARGVHQACTIVRAPSCDAHCQTTSCGCRPRRSAPHAVPAVKPARSRGWWGGAADRHPSVDPLAHTRRGRLVARRLRDRRGLKRSRQGLHAGGWNRAHGSRPRGGLRTVGSSAPCWQTSPGTGWRCPG
jgi:RNA-directed DNA polymerase